MAKGQAAFEIADQRVPAGSQRSIKLPAARLYTDTPIELHVEVFHGVKPGPTLLVCAALHGDELNGIDICRRLIKKINPKRLNGTLMVVPIVNVLGFIQQTRYLPDRRDLNRCFPGSQRGTLGGRLAYLFYSQLLQRATHLIDLHTGAINRSNLPQVRTDIRDGDALQMAEAFLAPVILHAKERDGSLRSTATDLGVHSILYEAGEALRFDEASIRTGLNGILNVMKLLGMAQRRGSRRKYDPVVANSSQWVRNELDGLIISRVRLGDRVTKGQILAYSASPHGDNEEPIRSPFDGIVIGMSNIPIANEGEALFHLAKFDRDRMDEAGEIVDAFIEDFEPRVL
ncbi:succinylglutamate desuccinylase/aspartoacylase family protein [Bowmanella dokdonensis]|uniref:Succinylglutamate desuccinylase/aspartoacylase family protein n=1 Tax=Bowmanella dokdonensis TaxID=751969 RepID=A0A939DK66_9ALTE|nr:succinylglutamate desuccinylase/aspartoacylase family protein [Bowmanella dokdonensis]MBN7823675.1 succinylglutamate desuccinylase/aspartoacylase family protein [Bowmanella dokdonensis]